MRRTAAVCHVKWCCALAAGIGGVTGRRFCAVHVAVPECHPKYSWLPPDYWRELDANWDGVSPLAVGESDDVDGDCAACDGSGNCPCCDGDGKFKCSDRSCMHSHECGTCDGDGQCAECAGTGYADGRAGDLKKTDADEMVRRWEKNRPSARTAA